MILIWSILIHKTDTICNKGKIAVDFCQFRNIFDAFALILLQSANEGWMKENNSDINPSLEIIKAQTTKNTEIYSNDVLLEKSNPKLKIKQKEIIPKFKMLSTVLTCNVQFIIRTM